MAAALARTPFSIGAVPTFIGSEAGVWDQGQGLWGIMLAGIITFIGSEAGAWGPG
jgi:hypothetical protein